MEACLEEKLELIFKRISGERVKDFAAKYEECEKKILKEAKEALEREKKKSGSFSLREAKAEPDLLPETPEDQSALELRKRRNEKFCEWLNIITHRNTDHIMDAALLRSTFATLKQPSQTLGEVEKGVAALAVSVGFPSLNDLMTYVSSPMAEISLKSDVEIFIKTKDMHAIDILNVLPSSQLVTTDAKAYASSLPSDPSEEDIYRILQPRVDAMARHIRPESIAMDPTPMLDKPGKKILRRLPVACDPSPLAQQKSVLDLEWMEADKMPSGAEKDARLAKIKAAMTDIETGMQDLLRGVVGYWERIFAIADEKKRLELMHQQEAELLAKSQVGEAERAVGAILDFLKKSERYLVSLPILVGEAHRFGGEIEMRIRDAINISFQNITSVPSDYFHALDELLSIGNDRTSVKSYLESIGIPPAIIEKFSPMTKRNLIIAVSAFLLYARM
jgi:hypothetical protein